MGNPAISGNFREHSNATGRAGRLILSSCIAQSGRRTVISWLRKVPTFMRGFALKAIRALPVLSPDAIIFS